LHALGLRAQGWWPKAQGGLRKLARLGDLGKLMPKAYCCAIFVLLMRSSLDFAETIQKMIFRIVVFLRFSCFLIVAKKKQRRK
jgi:hypothetical protein